MLHPDIFPHNCAGTIGLGNQIAVEIVDQVNGAGRRGVERIDIAIAAA
jgi:hypothetical protein